MRQSTGLRVVTNFDWHGFCMLQQQIELQEPWSLCGVCTAVRDGDGRRMWQLLQLYVTKKQTLDVIEDLQNNSTHSTNSISK